MYAKHVAIKQPAKSAGPAERFQVRVFPKKRSVRIFFLLNKSQNSGCSTEHPEHPGPPALEINTMGLYSEWLLALCSDSQLRFFVHGNQHYGTLLRVNHATYRLLYMEIDPLGLYSEGSTRFYAVCLHF